MEVGEGHKVNEDPDSVCVEEEFHVLSVMEEFVDELEETVSLCTVLTLGEGGGEKRREGCCPWLVHAALKTLLSYETQ